MKSKVKSSIVITLLLSTLLITTLLPNTIMAQETVTGTQDPETTGVWLFSAGTDEPAGAPTSPIIEAAVDYNILDYIGDEEEEVYDWNYGPSEYGSNVPIGQRITYVDTTLAEVVEGLSAIDDFGYIVYTGDDAANFDTGSEGYFIGGFDPALSQMIVADGIIATGELGPSGAINAIEAEEAIEGYEIFIFEDAELSGMIITLSNSLGLSITFTIEDLQVNPPTPYGADDTLIAIDLDNLPGFSAGDFIDTIKIQDDGITSPSVWGDTTLEIDAIAIRQVECTVNFYTDPAGSNFNITYESGTYVNGDSDTFTYGTSGLAEAHCPEGWLFDHWEIVGNVELSPDKYTNPVTFTIKCGGDLKAIFKQECTVNFYTDPAGSGFNITFEGDIYFDGDSGTFPYGTSGLATANVSDGWMFDHWEATGNVELSSTTTNPTTVTVLCGGTLKAVFTQTQCPVTFFTDPSNIGNITFEDVTYLYGQNATFLYGTFGNATANAPEGWVFDHWETVGNVQVSSTTENPTNFTITCGGNLTAVFRQTECPVVFFTDPSTVGNITFKGATYTYGETETFLYGTSGNATANCSEGWVFDHWTAIGNLILSSTTENPTNFTIVCGGNLTAVFIPVECTVNFYTDPSDVGNITVGSVTYFDGGTKVFNYSDTFSALANAPDGWVFDHWVATANLTLYLDQFANPVSVTVKCGGNLTAVFVEEYGNGDFGTIGYWKHVFYVWNTSKGTFKNYTGQILEWYLGNITETSTVFGENYILTLESAYELLWSHNSSMYTRALKQCLACWLNWANDAVTMSQTVVVDTNSDGIPDTFEDAMNYVEGILRDTNSSREELEDAKNICDSINNM